MNQALKAYAQSQGAVLDHDEPSNEPHFEYVGEIRQLTEAEKLEREKQLNELPF